MEEFGAFVMGVIAVIAAIYFAIVYWYFTLPLLAIGLWIYFAIDESNRKEAQAAERRRHMESQQQCQQEVVGLCERSMDLFESTPKHLKSAEEHLDQAERDFAEGVFAPFWDSVEKAARSLGHFDQGVRAINETSSHYTGLVKRLEATPPEFPLARQSVEKLAVGANTAERMKGIVRTAQRDFQFATIYEQRKTNQILVAGFTSLAQALDEMTWRITTSIDGLASSVDAMGVTLNESMAAIHSRMAETAVTVGRHIENVTTEASGRVAREKKVVEMLDNIQHRRRPR